jgi:hypothetical protein
LKALDENLPSPDDPAAALRKPGRSRPQESLAGITKKLKIRKLWKGECPPTTADA